MLVALAGFEGFEGLEKPGFEVLLGFETLLLLLLKGEAPEPDVELFMGSFELKGPFEFVLLFVVSMTNIISLF